MQIRLLFLLRYESCIHRLAKRRPRPHNCAYSNTFVLWCRPLPAGVHPCARGEHGEQRRDDRGARGSSPRSRGTHISRRASISGWRFIPALAGNTLNGNWLATSPTVHPRARGEHGLALETGYTGVGSSPRSRGTRNAGSRVVCGKRFIPALAGNTRHQDGPTSGQPVHPRARGEHFSNRSSQVVKPGSSPRSRGTRSAAAGRCSTDRFIPALAGNTNLVAAASGLKTNMIQISRRGSGRARYLRRRASSCGPARSSSSSG